MISPARLLFNSFWSLAFNLISKSANVVAFILLARLVGSEPAGVFSLGTTYMVIFSASAWGLDEYLTREVARDKENASDYFGSFLILRLIYTFAAYSLMALWVGKIVGYSITTSLPLMVLGLSIIPDGLANVAQAMMAARENFITQALTALLTAIIKITGLVVVLNGSHDLVRVGWIWVLGSSIGMAVLMITALRQGLWLRLTYLLRADFWRRASTQLLTFLGIGFLLSLEFQTDVVILSVVQNEQVVGWYGAVITVVFALTLIAQGFRGAIYPMMVRSSINNPSSLLRIHQRSTFYLAALAFPMAAGLTLCSTRIIELIFGQAFTPAALPLQVMAWMLIFSYMNIPNARMLLVYDRQHVLSRLLIISMAVNIVLNLFLAPSLGATGSALARVASSAILYSVSLIYLQQEGLVSSKIKQLVPVWVATGIMVAALWRLSTASLALVIPAGTIIYIVILLALRGLDATERTWLRSGWGKLVRRFPPGNQ